MLLGVTVAQMTLTHLVQVRILGEQRGMDDLTEQDIRRIIQILVIALNYEGGVSNVEVADSPDSGEEGSGLHQEPSQ